MPLNMGKSTMMDHPESGHTDSAPAQRGFDRRSFLKAALTSPEYATGCENGAVEKAIPFLSAGGGNFGTLTWYASTRGGCSAACGIHGRRTGTGG
jgi:hypothetical protein